ncbi:uroporphyrinogen decarboxylase [Methylocystis bryophila]|uniref:Uroporphyrinogen decarboxylase n=1 Tax=Methylocystis bryophila TaxID=655015 RepID=A0A1W6N163_9HYPH|nr:uroporphyrinogen decarboxylase [Methylocystis bryophila]
MSSDKPMLSVLRGEQSRIPPLWLMRQAGRFLPEYRALRAKSGSFLEFCYSPAAAAEATLQPIRRFGFDAAILFSDILVVPDALGQTVGFESGHGPRLAPLEGEAPLSGLREEIDLEKLAPVFETIERVKGALPRETAFIGFCGAPWTVASYMIAGHGTPDQAPARLFAYRRPEIFEALITRLVEASVAYLLRQIDAGVEVVQIFDSWAGVLPPTQFERWVFEPLRDIVARVKKARPQALVIAFPRGAGAHLRRCVEGLGADGVGLDTAADPASAARDAQNRVALQGNLDPLALIAGGAALEKEVASILTAFQGHRHIFNLGHGVLPQTPVEHVEMLVRFVREGRS